VYHLLSVTNQKEVTIVKTGKSPVVGPRCGESGRSRRGLDGTVLSVALPTLSKALHATESDLQWFTSYLSARAAASMLPAVAR